MLCFVEVADLLAAPAGDDRAASDRLPASFAAVPPCAPLDGAVPGRLDDTVERPGDVLLGRLDDAVDRLDGVEPDRPDDTLERPGDVLLGRLDDALDRLGGV